MSAEALKIRHLSLENIRGISSRIELNFCAEKCCSIVLAGDNGSGKSSIIDSIEFLLQGRMHHVSSPGKGGSPQIRSLFTDSLPVAELELSNSEHVKRPVVLDEKGRIQFDRKAHDAFKAAPFIMRRSDIQQFWSTPDIQRQIIFFDYFVPKETGAMPESLKAQIESLEEERRELKGRREAVRRALAQHLKMELSEVPTEPKAVGSLIRDRVYNGMTDKQRRTANYKGMRLKFDKKKVDTAKEYWEIIGLINTLAKRTRAIRKSEEAPQKRSEITSILEDVSPAVTEAFKSIATNAGSVKAIRINVGKISEVSLSFQVELVNGVYTTPQAIFSEANLDLLALLIFVETTRHAFDSKDARLLILDDVLQSVDAAIRVRFLDYLLAKMSDWQLIITTHDRLWQEQVIGMFRLHSHEHILYEIVRWDPFQGPVLLNANFGIEESLRKSLSSGSVQDICSAASIVLEKIANSLSFRLPIAVTRRPEDKYTIGDLWPGIYKVIKRTEISSIADEVNKTLYLRNMIGGHYNEWAQTLSRAEASQFGDSILALYEKVFCRKCGRWIEEVRIGAQAGRRWSCRCEGTFLSRLLVGSPSITS